MALSSNLTVFSDVTDGAPLSPAYLSGKFGVLDDNINEINILAAPSTPQTSTELAAGVTPSRTTYEPGDVRRYGTTGDGVADDAASINSAMKGAERIYFPAGDYLIESTITVPSNRIVTGYGGNSSRILQGAHNIVNMSLSDSTNVLVERLFFDWNDMGTTVSTAVNTGVNSDDGTSVTTMDKNCRVVDCGFDGLVSWAVRFGGGSAASYSRGVWIERNNISNQSDEGVALFRVRHAFIRGNYISSVSREGIKVTSAEDISIIDNYVESEGTLNLQGPLINAGTDVSRIRIANNHCLRGITGIGLEKGCTDTLVTANYCEGQGNEGIVLASTNNTETQNTNVVISGNVIRDVPHPINIVGVNGLWIGSVVVAGNSSEVSNIFADAPGLALTKVERATVVGNRFLRSGLGKDSIAASDVSTLVIQGNLLEQAQEFGLDATAVGELLFTGNAVVGPNQVNVKNYGGVRITSTVSRFIGVGNAVLSLNTTYQSGISTAADYNSIGHNIVIGQTGDAIGFLSSGDSGSQDFFSGQLGVSNAVANSTLGSVVHSIEVFDSAGSSLGFVPAYDAIT